MFALILNQKVVDISEKEFPVAPDFQWVDIKDNPNNICTGWGYVELKFTASLPAFTTTNLQLRMANYPTTHDIYNMLCKYMANSEIQACKDFCAAIEKANKEFPVDGGMAHV